MKLKNQVWKIPLFFAKCKLKMPKTAILLGLRQKWIIPSFSPQKVVSIFGKEHVN